MSWFFENLRFESEKNGRIDCHRRLGVWEVFVGGYGETAPYLKNMWQQAFERLPKQAIIKNILIIGFGAGGNIRQLHDRFPECTITAIEWDPVMVEIADRIKLFPADWRPTIIVDDASVAVHALNLRFDLILFDAYSGNNVMNEVRDGYFFERVRQLLEPTGFFLYNWSSQSDVIAIIKQYLYLFGDWQHYYNRIALFCQKDFAALENKPRS